MSRLLVLVTFTSLPVGALGKSLPIVICEEDLACHQHSERGYVLFQKEQYIAALTEYEAAYARRPAPHLLFNIARTLHRLGRLSEAVGKYQRYLSEGTQESEEKRQQARMYQQQALREVAEAIEPTKASTANSSPSLFTKPLSREHNNEPQVVSSNKESTDASKEISKASNFTKQRIPLYKKWWFWTLVGFGIAGIATGIAAGASTSGSASNPIPNDALTLMPRF